MKASGISEDGHYLIHLSDRCQDPVRVYCRNMASVSPKEFITLESGPDNNYAIIYGQRLRDRYSCSGPARAKLYAERGTTKFSKVRLDLRTMTVIDNDFTFAESSPRGRNVPYGTAGTATLSILVHAARGALR